MLELLGGLTGSVLMELYCGVLFCYLWGWFIVPVFKLPALTVVQAIGISLVALMLQQIRTDDPQPKKSWGEVMALKFVLYSFIFVFGWGWHFFLPK